MAGERKLTIIIQGDDQTSASVSSATDGMGKLGAAATAMASVVAAAGVAAGAGLVAGLNRAIEQEASTDRLAARLGLNPEEHRRLGDLAGSLYADAYGSSLDEVTLAVETVYGSIEGMATASTAELESVTRAALDVAGAFDIDVSSAATAAGIAVRTGLVGNATEAFDLIVASAQRTSPMLRESVLDAANEYGQFFVALGLDGPQAFGALTTAAGYGQEVLDKVGDALKEFGIRSSDMSVTSQAAYTTLGMSAQDMSNRFVAGGETANAAFQEVVSGLLAIEDPVLRANTAIQLFGTPIEDLGNTKIPQFLQSLSGSEAALGDFGGAAERMGVTLNDNAITSITELGRTIEMAVVEKLNAALPYVQAAAMQLTALSETASARLVPALTAVRDRIRELVSGVEIARPKFDEVTAGAQSFADRFVAAGEKVRPIIDDLTTKFGDKFAEIQPKVQKYLDALTSTVGSALELLGILFSGAATSIGWIWDTFGEDLWRTLSPVIDIILALVTGLFGMLDGQLEFFIGLFTGDWDRMFDGLISANKAFNDMMSGLSMALYQMLLGAMGLIRTMWDTAWAYIRNNASRALDFVRSTASSFAANLPMILAWGAQQAANLLIAGFNRMPSGVQSAVSGVVSAAARIVSSVVSTVSGLGSRLYSAGYEAIDRLADGIRAAISRVRGAISDVTRTISRYLPGSPVKEGPLRVLNNGYAGKQISKMVQGGIEAESTSLTASVGSVLSVAAAPATSSLSPTSASPSPTGGDTYVLDLRGSIVPDGAAFEDLLSRALDRLGRAAPGRLSVAGRPI